MTSVVIASNPRIKSGGKQSRLRDCVDRFAVARDDDGKWFDAEAICAGMRGAADAFAAARERSSVSETQDLSHFVRHPIEGVAAMDLVVEGVHCGACIATIEKGLGRESGVRGARVNLASKRVTVEWRDGELKPETILDRLSSLGRSPPPTSTISRRRRRSACCAASASPPSAR
jgi:copper chaperone CopZ